MPLIDVPTVHAVTDAATFGRPGFIALASALLRAFGQKVALHLRSPGVSAAALYAAAATLAEVQAESGGWVVVSDRVDVAMASGALGVQLRAGSLGVADARRLAPALRVGVSVHNAATAGELAAGPARPDWLIAGNVFETPTHPGLPARGEEFIRAVSRAGVPVIAIGGVRPEDAVRLRMAGAAGIAAIRGIWGAPDPVAAAALYL